MKTHYTTQQILKNNTGNNAFSFSLRNHPTIILPSLQIIESVSEVTLGDHCVFEEIDHTGALQTCTGLKHIYLMHATSTYPDTVIMDNHNHALYRRGKHSLALGKALTILHVDQHSDLTDCDLFDGTKRTDGDYLWNFANLTCNVGNFIKPALAGQYISACIQIRSEIILEEIVGKKQENSYILDIDLDFRAPEMSIKHYEKTIQQTKQLMSNASLITIATSPYFIEQNKALAVLSDLFS